VSLFRSTSPADWQARIEHVDRFHKAYVAYLNDTLEQSYQGRPPGNTDRRNEVQTLAIRAQSALRGSVVVGVRPPPVYRGQSPRIGLAAVAFAHEDEIFRPISEYGPQMQQPYEMAIDAVVQGRAWLVENMEDEEQRRRRFTYWPDRVLRSVLGFPAYLISLVLGFDLGEVSAEKRKALWLLAIAADIAGLVGLGELLGWWDLAPPG